jgi:hypothetical protein
VFLISRLKEQRLMVSLLWGHGIGMVSEQLKGYVSMHGVHG